MNVYMKKITETDAFVEYQFEMSKPGGEYTFENNRPILVSGGIAYGYCIFNKLTQEFTLDEQKSDPYFLQLNEERPIANGLCKEICYVYCKLVEVTRKKNQFPETIHIATG